MKYKKDFDEWNLVKKRLDINNQEIFFNKKEIWWCFVGVNIGSENDGKGEEFLRPVYILQKINFHTFVGIPLTSNLKENTQHVPLYFNYDLSSAMLCQIRTFDRRRLAGKIGIVSDYLHTKIEKATIAFLQS